jgi:hypothetical protein
VRVLSLGCALPDSQIDNFDWGSAPSFYDYDAIIVDPAQGISELIEGILRHGASQLTYSDEPIEDGPTTATATGLTDLLRRRRDETERLLARGGLVICFAYPDVPHPRVSGFPGCHRYYWLPAPSGGDYSQTYLKPAHGTTVTVTDYEHPFADVLEKQRQQVLYRVQFAEGAGGLGADAKVFGRSSGGAAIAMDLTVGRGRIVFLPALPSRLTPGERSGIAGAIVTAARNLLLISAEEKPPEWLDGYPLPGIEEARNQIDDAEARLETLESELDEARNKYRGLDRYRRLLWQEGKFGFDLPVRDALALLGLTSYARPDDPATMQFGGETILMETESSPHAIGMEPHYRLRQRLEAQIASEGKRPRGLIVINGHRELAPSERPQQYEEPLRVAAESMRYAVVEATAIFAAVRDHFEGRGDKAAFCRRLIETEGIVTFESRPETPAAAPADQ